jgi:hypothetical protein
LGGVLEIRIVDEVGRGRGVGGDGCDGGGELQIGCGAMLGISNHGLAFRFGRWRTTV